MKDFVREIYEKYKETFDDHLDIYDKPTDKSESYVYEWYTVATNKVFYVGKGVKDRYKHILQEIKTCEDNPKKYKGQRWKELRDAYGIDCRIIMDGLTDEEAQIMELYYIAKRIRERNPLLQHIIPWDSELLDEEDYNYWLSVNYPPKGTSIIESFK